VLHGAANPGDIVTVRQIRGMIDGALVQVVGDGHLVAGERVILMLRHVGPRYYLTTLGQSVFRLGGDGPEAPVQQQLDGLLRMNEPDTPAPPTAPATAAELRRAIRDAGARQ